MNEPGSSRPPDPSLREIVDRATASREREPEPEQGRRPSRRRPSRALRLLIGLVMFYGGLGGICYALVRLMHIGTCAAGNTPYQIARPCPSGTGMWIGIVVGSIFLTMIGAAIWRPGISLTLGIVFAAIGAASLYGGLTAPASVQGAAAAGYSVGIPFIVIGLATLAFALWWRLSDRGDTEPTLTAAGLAQLIAATAPKPVSGRPEQTDKPKEGG
jgi:hypothetical protein